MKSLTLQQKITLAAEGCRDGLATLKYRRGSMFEGFPCATCGPASEIVGRILKVVFQIDGTYVHGVGHPGLPSNQSHAWFEVDVYLIDITHDQFDGTGLASWILPQDNTWHSQFECIERRSSFCGPEGWPMYPHDAYEAAFAAVQIRV